MEHQHGELEEDACLICLETIARTAATWQCPRCFTLMHLGCTKNWIAKGEAKSTQLSKVIAFFFSFVFLLKLFSFQEHFPDAFGYWSCPLCRTSFKDKPSKYLCFCGKKDLSKDVEVDHFREAHSCGDLCEKPLACGHLCTLLCHSSACPSCSRMFRQDCFCKRQFKMLRCGQVSFSCASLCGKQLECGHSCELKCHEGNGDKEKPMFLLSKHARSLRVYEASSPLMRLWKTGAQNDCMFRRNQLRRSLWESGLQRPQMHKSMPSEIGEVFCLCYSFIL